MCVLESSGFQRVSAARPPVLAQLPSEGAAELTPGPRDGRDPIRRHCSHRAGRCEEYCASPCRAHQADKPGTSCQCQGRGFFWSTFSATLIGEELGKPFKGQGEAGRDGVVEQMPENRVVGSVVTVKELSNEKYVIGKILRGGMGEVYQLIPVMPFGPTFALKTYQQTATREQFIRGVDHWISLGNHAHIARALVYLEWQSRPSIIGEWYKQTIDNPTAENWPTAKLIHFTLGLLDGLEYAHRVGGIIHQDVKPANILLDTDDQPRLTDFGMARFATRGESIDKLEDINASMMHSVTLGPVGGTPMYMAPELFAGQLPSVQTDIFSLGVTLYQIATGEHPYCGPETRHRLRPALRMRSLELFLQKRGNDVARLVSLITAAVQIDPQMRPNSYRALYQLIGQENASVQDAHGEGIRDVITRASFLRETGRTQESLELLEAAIAERPANPELMNSFAILLLKLDQRQRAYAIWNSAAECLRLTDGRHNRSLYLDPVVTWRTKPKSGGGLLLLRRKASLKRRSVPSFAPALIAQRFTT